MKARTLPLIFPLLLASCGGIASDSFGETGGPVPSETATPREEPRVSTAPSAEPSPTPQLAFLPPGSRARVIVNGLRVREQPSTSSPEIATVPMGTEVVILGSFDDWGPVVEEGIPWYPVGTRYGNAEIRGWVAGGPDGSPYMETLSVQCPASQDTETVLAMAPWERLSCLGAKPIELNGVTEVACQGGIRPETSVYEPAWLANWCPAWVLTNRTSIDVTPNAGVVLALPPSLDGALGDVGHGSIVRITGHVDDPVSSSCHVVPNDEHEWSQPAVQVLCREQFVVTAIEVLGRMDLPSPG